MTFAVVLQVVIHFTVFTQFCVCLKVSSGTGKHLSEDELIRTTFLKRPWHLLDFHFKMKLPLPAFDPSTGDCGGGVFPGDVSHHNQAGAG